MLVPNDKTIDKDLMDTAVMLIDGGGNRDTPPSWDDDMIKYGRVWTMLTGNIFITLKQIPNERLVFVNDWKESRTEGWLEIKQMILIKQNDIQPVFYNF